MQVQSEFRPASFVVSLNALSDGSILRRHVDEWISSGCKDGTEDPKRRRLGHNLVAELDFLNREDRPFEVIPSADGSILGRFSRRNMLLPPESIGVPEAHRQQDAENAAFSMLLFLDHGDLRHRIAKCTRPGCTAPYFIRARLRESYSRPARCSHHRLQAASDRARKGEREKLLGLAVQFWPQWTNRQHPNRALWIANQINAKRKGTERRITQKWVSRNINVATGIIKRDAKG